MRGELKAGHVIPLIHDLFILKSSQDSNVKYRVTNDGDHRRLEEKNQDRVDDDEYHGKGNQSLILLP